MKSNRTQIEKLVNPQCCFNSDVVEEDEDGDGDGDGDGDKVGDCKRENGEDWNEEMGRGMWVFYKEKQICRRNKSLMCDSLES